MYVSEQLWGGQRQPPTVSAAHLVTAPRIFLFWHRIPVCVRIRNPTITVLQQDEYRDPYQPSQLCLPLHCYALLRFALLGFALLCFGLLCSALLCAAWL